jgi:hypothetical protein
MHKNLRRIFYIFIFIAHTITNTSNFELYNAQPYAIYYAIQNTQSCNQEYELQELCAHAYVNQHIDTPIHLIILKEVPSAPQKIQVIICEPQQAVTNIYVKTHELQDGTLTLIPQSKQPLHPAQTAGTLELKNCITPYEIWKTTCIYTPPQKEPKQEISDRQLETEHALPSSTQNKPESYAQQSDLTTDIMCEDTTTTETQTEASPSQSQPEETTQTPSI